MKKLTLMTALVLTCLSLETKADKPYQMTIKCPSLDTPIIFNNNSNCLTSGGYCYHIDNQVAWAQVMTTQPYATPHGQLGLTWISNTQYPGLTQEQKSIKGTFKSSLISTGPTKSSPLQLLCEYNVVGFSKDTTLFLAAFLKAAKCETENGIFHCKM